MIDFGALEERLAAAQRATARYVQRDSRERKKLLAQLAELRRELDAERFFYDRIAELAEEDETAHLARFAADTISRSIAEVDQLRALPTALASDFAHGVCSSCWGGMTNIARRRMRRLWARISEG